MFLVREFLDIKNEEQTLIDYNQMIERINQWNEFPKESLNLFQHFIKQSSEMTCFYKEIKSYDMLRLIIYEGNIDSLDLLQRLKQLGLEVSCKIDNCKLIITYRNERETEGEKRPSSVAIDFCISNKIDYTEEKKLKFEDLSESRYETWIFYGITGIYVRRNSKVYPLGLKDILKSNFESLEWVKKELFQFLSTRAIIYKDLLNDYEKDAISVGICCNDLASYHNKRALLQDKLKLSLPKSINKMSLQQAYYNAKFSKLVSENWKPEILTFQMVAFSRHQEKERMREYFREVYEKRIPDMEFDDGIFILNDYIQMAYQIEKKFDLSIRSFKRLIREHDRLAIEYQCKYTPVIKIPKDYPFKNLKLPEQYEMIKTKKRIVEESIINDNCVASYASSINKGVCAIYSTVYSNGKRYTIEIRRRRKKFILWQISGRKNHPAPPELIAEIRGLLSSV